MRRHQGPADHQRSAHRRRRLAARAAHHRPVAPTLVQPTPQHVRDGVVAGGHRQATAAAESGPGTARPDEPAAEGAHVPRDLRQLAGAAQHAAVHQAKVQPAHLHGHRPHLPQEQTAHGVAGQSQIQRERLPRVHL